MITSPECLLRGGSASRPVLTEGLNTQDHVEANAMRSRLVARPESQQGSPLPPSDCSGPTSTCNLEILKEFKHKHSLTFCLSYWRRREQPSPLLNAKFSVSMAYSHHQWRMQQRRHVLPELSPSMSCSDSTHTHTHTHTHMRLLTPLISRVVQLRHR